MGRSEARPVPSLAISGPTSRSSQSCTWAPSSTPAAPRPTSPRNTRRPTGVPAFSITSRIRSRTRPEMIRGGKGCEDTEPERPPLDRSGGDPWPPPTPPTFELPGFQGELFSPGDRLRRGPGRLQRHDRPAAGAHRPVRRRRRRRRRGEPRPRPGRRPVGLRRWPRRDRRARSSTAGSASTSAGMKGISVDPEAQTVRAEGGAHLGRVRRRDRRARPRRHRRACARRPGSPGSRSAAGAAGSSASSGSPATTWSRPRSSPPTAARWSRRRPRTPTCSGGSGAAAATSASSPRSTSGCTRCPPLILAGMLIYPAAVGADLLRFYRDFMLARARRGGRRRGVHHRATGAVRAAGGAGTPGRSAIVVSYAGPVEEGERVARAAARVRAARDRPRRADAVRRDAGSSSSPGTRTACRTTGPPTSTTRCPTRRSTCSSRARPAGVADVADPRRPRRRRRQPRARRRDGVRPAARAVEHPLPVDVGRPGRHRGEHRVHPRDRRAR